MGEIEQNEPEAKLTKAEFSAVYESKHPEAVVDQEQARVEAVEGDESATEAVTERNTARNALLAAQMPGQNEDSRRELIERAREHVSKADVADLNATNAEYSAGADYKEAGELLDKLTPGSEK